MNPRNFALFALLCTLLASTTYAKEKASTRVKNQDEDVRNKDESWYFNIGLNFFVPSYGSDVDAALNQIKSNGGTTRVSLGLDIAFYWPLADRQTILGPSLIGESDTYSINGYTLSLTQAMLAFSAQHYFGENVGDGFFVRGDVGPANFGVKAEYPSGATLVNAQSATGIGFQAGGGYSFLLSNETRLGVGAYFAHYAAGGDVANNFLVSGNFLF